MFVHCVPAITNIYVNRQHQFVDSTRKLAFTKLSSCSAYTDNIIILDIRISADASRRPLQLKAAACQTFEVYQENHGDPLHVQVIIIIIILRMRSACAEA